MSAWAFCSEEQVREVFLLCRRGIWGASGEASRKTPACSFKIFFLGASVTGISQSRNQSTQHFASLAVFGRHPEKG